jgi:FAD/FMN-containing dehydrogenase
MAQTGAFAPTAKRSINMTYRIERTLRRLGQQLPGRLSLPGNDRYIAATAIWAKPAGGMPRAVAHCRTPEDVQSTIRAARSCDLPLSVRGGVTTGQAAPCATGSSSTCAI